jgi:hypothetical protein
MAGSFQLPSVICRDRDALQAPNDRLLQDLNSDPQSSSKVGEIVRSTSTPDICGQAAADAALAASVEKRRNKLGYHRTSVACGMMPMILCFMFSQGSSFDQIHPYADMFQDIAGGGRFGVFPLRETCKVDVRIALD